MESSESLGELGWLLIADLPSDLADCQWLGGQEFGGTGHSYSCEVVPEGCVTGFRECPLELPS